MTQRGTTLVATNFAVPIFPTVAPATRRYEHFRDIHCVLTVEPKNLVCPSETGDFLARDNFTGRVLPTLLKRAEVTTEGMAFHRLRHSGGSLLAQARVPESTIERWLGHTHAKGVRGLYVHSYDEDLAEAAAVMGEISAPVWGREWDNPILRAQEITGTRKEKNPQNLVFMRV